MCVACSKRVAVVDQEQRAGGGGDKGWGLILVPRSDAWTWRGPGLFGRGPPTDRRTLGRGAGEVRRARKNCTETAGAPYERAARECVHSGCLPLFPLRSSRTRRAKEQETSRPPTSSSTEACETIERFLAFSRRRAPKKAPAGLDVSISPPERTPAMLQRAFGTRAVAGRARLLRRTMRRRCMHGGNSWRRARMLYDDMRATVRAEDTKRQRESGDKR